ncbi:hypothetical protein CYMTET_19823 [Cymbomonas tetramitiformis]|uniref:Uncharacterized protein n=1 Tax=Cymbomonas tetramitiformis TaxID=36881 RepID=A0AAE0G590_9CHLO|nr:hypothetical protein CYMTET_19823 [Cymbomonas tetramitiformis]
MSSSETTQKERQEAFDLGIQVSMLQAKGWRDLTDQVNHHKQLHETVQNTIIEDFRQYKMTTDQALQQLNADVASLREFAENERTKRKAVEELLKEERQMKNRLELEFRQEESRRKVLEENFESNKDHVAELEVRLQTFVEALTMMEKTQGDHTASLKLVNDTHLPNRYTKEESEMRLRDTKESVESLIEMSQNQIVELIDSHGAASAHSSAKAEGRQIKALQDYEQVSKDQINDRIAYHNSLQTQQAADVDALNKDIVERSNKQQLFVTDTVVQMNKSNAATDSRVAAIESLLAELGQGFSFAKEDAQRMAERLQVIDENLGSTQKQVMSESDSISQVELRLDAEEARLTGMEKLVNEDVSETLSMLNHGLNVELKKTIRELQDQLEREISARERLNLNLTNESAARLTLESHVKQFCASRGIPYVSGLGE